MSDPVDSSSLGDPDRHAGEAALEAALDGLPPAPRAVGQLIAIIRRSQNGSRERLLRAALTRGGGLDGDAWARPWFPDAESQITAMQARVASVLANRQPLELFGDNLFVELDLATASLPAGSRVRIGTAVLEVTAKPHNGCKKFRARFGDAALRVVSRAERRHLNLRGIHLRVVEDGEVEVGSEIAVISRTGG
jgi:MOSC domain-containing protein YiiM